MCDSCGCSQPDDAVTISRPGTNEEKPAEGRVIQVQEDILGKNNHLAQHNREHLEKKRILALNLLSSPGSGKTTLLEETIKHLKDAVHMAVIEGDQQTLNDAERIESTGVDVVQVNTGAGCHLDADMIHHAIHEIEPKEDSILFIENVGNLVCPAMFDLGEAMKVVIISVTEGEDKPIKYPYMFREADLCVITKTDLLPYLDFDLEQCKKYATSVKPDLEFFEVSAKDGNGLDDWCSWVVESHKKAFQ